MLCPPTVSGEELLRDLGIENCNSQLRSDDY